MDEHTAQADLLLGALIGLARAVSKQGKTPDTDGVLLSGLQALNSRAAEPTLRAETDKTHAEKDRIAPECALCAMPCGSTADGDMQAVWNAREPVRAKKAALLQAACARRGLGSRSAGGRLRGAGDGRTLNGKLRRVPLDFAGDVRYALGKPKRRHL